MYQFNQDILEDHLLPICIPISSNEGRGGYIFQEYISHFHRARSTVTYHKTQNHIPSLIWPSACPITRSEYHRNVMAFQKKENFNQANSAA